MPTKDELRARLIDKLRELFQLNRPELDFGLYRIMHAKDEEVTDYLENGLPETLKEVLGNVNEEKIEERKREYEEKLQTAKDYGAENPEEADRVKEAKKKYEAAKQSANADEKVYDHLYRFFSRYYEKGDFISRRYRVRETDTQAAPYAIPYNGEEVKLHWANADQYYIKTAEHFRNFRFDLREAVEETADENAPDLDLGDDEALPVHFRIVEGEEGEHDNVQDKNSKVRKLKPHTSDLLEVTSDGGLIVNFEVVFQKSQGEYIYDSEMEERLEDKYGTSVGKKDKEPLAVAETVFDQLGEMDDLNPAYETLLRYVPPPNRKATPPLLARYYQQFADKHEMDYFIHKDLGGFLRRELDFYIKNEVMRLDDIQRAEAPRVERYLDTVQALRRVAHDIIDFLAQLENFQKKLWLKKKFVVETGYCVTLDRVPDSLYDTILDNDAQLEEWRDLYAVDEWNDDLFSQDYEDGALTRDFLEAHPHVMIDTRHFNPTFTDRLLVHLGNQTVGGLGEAVDGRCVQGENFQALNLLKRRFQEKVQCVYIDPPYNTGNDGFVYKDNYRHSSWMSMIADRVQVSHPFISKSGALYASIDDREQENLKNILDNIFGRENFLAQLVWEKVHTRKNSAKYYSVQHEYIQSYVINKTSWRRSLIPRKDTSAYQNPDDDPRGPWKPDPITAHNPYSADYEIELPDGTKLGPPEDRYWAYSKESWDKFVEEDRVLWGKGDSYPMVKRYLDEVQDGLVPVTLFEVEDYLTDVLPREKFGDTALSKKEIDSLFSFSPDIEYTKPSKLIKQICYVSAGNSDDVIMDYFAGSGTTGHAVIDFNREDGGKRKYILVEMDDYFDNVMLPRLKKVAFSNEWDNGVPESIDSQSHVIKYHRLESYEDTLNNLELNQDENRQEALDQNEDLRRDYRLRYMLDMETKGSPSLLDIDEFADPRQYHLKVKKPGSDASTQTNVDLLETFNYLLGLRVEQINVPETFTADFHRPEDPELPDDERTRLEIDGEMEADQDGDWWFRSVTGWVPSDPLRPDDSEQEHVLVIWRTLTDDREQDNVMLNAYVDDLQDQALDVDRIYVNGSNNMAGLRHEDENWSVELLEKEFMERMWDVQDV
jgi:adenine-specific DNA-methyltransferase